jgi:AcrR family transcriptional regulator
MDTNPAASPTPRWQRRPAERREEILAAARTVFGEDGFARAKIADVARRAGVSSATVSHYFGSKATLFEAMVADAALDFSEGALILAPTAAGYRGALHQLIELKWQRMTAPGMPDLTLTVLREIGEFPLSAQQLFRQLMQRFRERLEAVLEAGSAAGEFHLDGPPSHAAHVISALLLGAMLNLHFVAACTRESSCVVTAFETIRGAVDRLVGCTTTPTPSQS